MIKFLMMMCVLMAGISLGLAYAWFFYIKPLKIQNRNLRKVEVQEMTTFMGTVQARTSEWPLNAEEYLTFHDIERDGGIIEISYEALESDLNNFAQHLLTRQKADFMKMCKEIKHGDKIKAKLNS